MDSLLLSPKQLRQPSELTPFPIFLEPISTFFALVGMAKCIMCRINSIAKDALQGAQTGRAHSFLLQHGGDENPTHTPRLLPVAPLGLPIYIAS